MNISISVIALVPSDSSGQYQSFFTLVSTLWAHTNCSYACFFQGRPKGVTPKFSLAPLVPRLSELLGIQVTTIGN